MNLLKSRGKKKSEKLILKKLSDVKMSTRINLVPNFYKSPV